MKTAVSPKPTPTTAIFRRLDALLFAGLILFLAFVIAASGMANVQTDAIDYYTIVQRLVRPDDAPLAANLHFVEQRSPGYPLLALLPYQAISRLLAPRVQTEAVVAPVAAATNTAVPPAPTRTDQPASERMLIPAEPLRLRDLFFRDFAVAQRDSWFRWQISAALLLTSYAFFFAGLLATVGALALERRAVVGASLAPLLVVASPVFMHNVVNTPSYATLTAFGVSGLFTYFFVRGSLAGARAPQLLAGLFMGLLVLVRLETAVMAIVVGLALAAGREFRLLRSYVLGGLPAVVALLAYNASQFGDPLHLGILQGDINRIAFDWRYVVANLVHPQSGLLLWSAPLALGLAGLLLAGPRYARILGVSALILIGLTLFRVPVMYHCVGEGTRLIGGVAVMCPETLADARLLVRADANRYVTALAPFAALGLRGLATAVFPNRPGG